MNNQIEKTIKSIVENSYPVFGQKQFLSVIIMIAGEYGISRKDCEKALITLNRQGEITLTRCDLIRPIKQQFGAEIVDSSLVTYMNSEFHFVVIR